MHSAQHLVTPLTTIHTPSEDRTTTPTATTTAAVDPAALLSPKFFNDLDISADRKNIYFSDSSFKNTRSENRREVLDGAPRGRLFKYCMNSKQLTVLLCGLHFPNGVQFLNPRSSKSPLLLAESARFRILKVNVNKPSLRNKQGVASLLSSCGEDGPLKTHLNTTSDPYVSTWMDRAPGFIDNIRADAASVRRGEGKVRFFVGLGTKSSRPFSLLWLAYQLKVRVCVCASVYWCLLVFVCICVYAP